MGRKKVDKESLEYLVSQLFHRDKIIGFQFTAGRTPRAIADGDDLYFSASLNKNTQEPSCVVDCYESEVEIKILQIVFPKKNFGKYEHNGISFDEMRSLQEQFRKLDFEVDESKFMGEWYWFRIYCNVDEIVKYVNILKENVKLNIF